MTLQQAAQAALDVQDAVNLSGAVFTFAEAMQAVCDEQQRLGEGTEWKNHHPIAVMFAEKIAELATGCGIRDSEGTFDSNRYHTAYTACKRLAAGGTTEGA